ncbi:hypothetical protein CYMTET_41562 [Cymbomonas tetramitiformis]|uniref:Reverse transcriptase n=1 Tax=Cymbomonas tetramitiformis TaxID=36881 RepID=A0AAE0C774_9CHLO|nr:hypothetical protein CYMTET_41562 [Cymbomonas tetramitiformis]
MERSELLFGEGFTAHDLSALENSGTPEKLMECAKVAARQRPAEAKSFVLPLFGQNKEEVDQPSLTPSEEEIAYAATTEESSDDELQVDCGQQRLLPTERFAKDNGLVIQMDGADNRVLNNTDDDIGLLILLWNKAESLVTQDFVVVQVFGYCHDNGIHDVLALDSTDIVQVNFQDEDYKVVEPRGRGAAEGAAEGAAQEDAHGNVEGNAAEEAAESLRRRLRRRIVRRRMQGNVEGNATGGGCGGAAQEAAPEFVDLFRVFKEEVGKGQADKDDPEAAKRLEELCKEGAEHQAAVEAEYMESMAAKSTEKGKMPEVVDSEEGREKCARRAAEGKRKIEEVEKQEAAEEAAEEVAKGNAGEATPPVPATAAYSETSQSTISGSEVPEDTFYSVENYVSKEHWPAMQAEILKEKAAGNVVEVRMHWKVQGISAVGIVERERKGVIKFRPVWDYSRPEDVGVNSRIDLVKEKFASVKDAYSLLRPGLWMAKVDLTAAYRSVPVAARTRKQAK